MDELRTYADRRLELGDMIRAALHLARGSGMSRPRTGPGTWLAAGTFQLAVVGQFSWGKTTLMNALLGGPYLPMGALPMTSGSRGSGTAATRRRSCAAVRPDLMPGMPRRLPRDHLAGSPP